MTSGEDEERSTNHTTAMTTLISTVTYTALMAMLISTVLMVTVGALYLTEWRATGQ